MARRNPTQLSGTRRSSSATEAIKGDQRRQRRNLYNEQAKPSRLLASLCITCQLQGEDGELASSAERLHKKIKYNKTQCCWLKKKAHLFVKLCSCPLKTWSSSRRFLAPRQSTSNLTSNTANIYL